MPVRGEEKLELIQLRATVMVKCLEHKDRLRKLHLFLLVKGG